MLFVNAALEVGPCSRASSCLLDVSLRFGTFGFLFHTLYVVTDWRLHTRCPQVDAQKHHHEHSNIRKYRQRAGSLPIQTPLRSSSGSQVMLSACPINECCKDMTTTLWSQTVNDSYMCSGIVLTMHFVEHLLVQSVVSVLKG